jgi:outer membrane protein assembly factor BamA
MIIRLVGLIIILFSQTLTWAQTPESLALSASLLPADKPTFTVLDKIILEGNQKTLPHIILRELDIQEGDTLWLTKIDTVLQRNRNKIFNTNLFITVDLTLEKDSSHTTHLRIKLEERWYLFPLPLFELSDRNFNEWWNTYNRDFSRTNYGLRLIQDNFRGRKERLDLLIQFGFNRRFGLNYNIPYLDRRRKAGLSLGFSYSQNKSVAFQTLEHKLDFLEVPNENKLRERWESYINFTYRNAFYSFHQAYLRFRHHWVADTVARLNPDYFLDGRRNQYFFTLGYKFRRDVRDIQVYPLKGKLWEIGIEKNGLSGMEGIDNIVISGSIGIYQQIAKRFYIDNQLSGMATFQNRQPYANAQAIGYNEAFIRGYELYVIDGQGFLLNKNTLKFEVFNKVKKLNFVPIRQFSTVPIAMYLTTYGDFGYVKDEYFGEKNNFLANKLIYGWGVGLDLVTFYNLVFRFNYAWNSRGEGGFYFAYKTKF